MSEEITREGGDIVSFEVEIFDFLVEIYTEDTPKTTWDFAQKTRYEVMSLVRKSFTIPWISSSFEKRQKIHKIVILYDSDNKVGDVFATWTVKGWDMRDPIGLTPRSYYYETYPPTNERQRTTTAKHARNPI